MTDAAVAFIVCEQLANHEPMAARLAPSVAAGFMPAELLPIFEGAAKALYSGKPQTQRDEAIRTATFGAAPLASASATVEDRSVSYFILTPCVPLADSRKTIVSNCLEKCSIGLLVEKRR